MGILQIRKQLLSTVIGDFMICHSCGIVDKDQGRLRVGYKCTRCGIPGRAIAYFPVSVWSLIDLAQEFFHLAHDAIPDSKSTAGKKKTNSQLAVVIFFCTLVEVLLQHFLKKRMSKMGLQYEIQERLLKDNLYFVQRVERLFPTLIGMKWKRGVQMLPERVDYIETIEFYDIALKVRNKFLHSGNKWAVPKDMPKECINHLPPLLSLFVALHNKYVAESIQ